MKVGLLNMCVIMMATLASPVQSLLFAEIYQWTDADGSTHFSDTPIKAPKGKKPIVRQDGSNISPSLPPRTPAPPVPINYEATSKPRPSMEPACNLEYTKAAKKCEPSDSQKKADGYDSSEFATRMMRLEIQQCVNRNVSPVCKEQFDKLMIVIEKDSIKSRKCMETRQNIYRICGYPQKENAECHIKHMAELEAACKM